MESVKNIFVFKTNIKTKDDKQIVKEVLEANTLIEQWSVDLHDCDCVLRIVSTSITMNEVIELVNLTGYECHELE